VFVDEAGFSQIPSVHKTWAPKGRTPIIRHHLVRKQVHMMAGVVCRPDGTDCDVIFYMQPESINSWSAMAFLDALHEEIEGPLVVLWDGLSVHHSKIVKDHVRANQDWLRTERLPSYAPELNPPEYLFSALRAKDMGKFCAETIEQIADKLETAADRIGNQTNIVQGFLKASSLFDKQELVT
jgi:transposase